MKNNSQQTHHDGKHFRWGRQVVKVRKSLPFNHQKSRNLVEQPESSASVRHTVDDLANHEVETLGYDYYMDSYN